MRTRPRARAAAPTGSADWSLRAAQLLAALGGTTNVESVAAASTRLRVRVRDPRNIDERAVAELGLRGMALPAPGVVHIIVGPEAAAAAAALRHLLT